MTALAAAIINDRAILSSGRILHKHYDRKGSFEVNIAGREPQGAWRQDELIGVNRQS
jgi:hypothetical protein